MRSILASLALGAALTLTGCHSTPASTPSTAPTLNETYSRAAVAMRDFSADVRQAQQIEISLYHGGAIDKVTHVGIQNGFLQTAKYAKQVDALILGQASAATIQAKVAAALASIQGLTIATGTLDPGATAQLKATIQALTLILNNVNTILGTQVGANYGPGTDRNPRGASTVAGLDHLPAVRGLTGSVWIASEATR